MIFFIPFIFLFIIFPLYGQQIQPERIFNLDQSITTALHNRKEALLVKKDIEIAKERMIESRALFYPKIDLTFNYAYLETDRLTTLPPAFGSLSLLPLPLMIPGGYYRGDYYLTRLSLWQYVYAGGRYGSNLKLAEGNLVRAENQLKVVTNDITYLVEESFYKLISTEQKLDIYKIVISSIEKTLENIESKNTDQKLLIEQTLQELKREYSLLTNQQEKQKLDFLNTIGLELNTTFKLESKLEPKIESYDLYKLLAWAFQYRPEPKQIQVQEEMDALAVKLALATRYPTVSLGLHYEFTDERVSLDRKNWNVILNLSLPIFDGWSSWSRIRQRYIIVEQNKLRRKDIEDSIRLEVRKSYINYTFYTEELKDVELQLKKAETFLVDAKTIPEVIQSQRFYLKTKLSYIDTICEHLISHAAIEHSIAKPLESK